MKAAQIKEFGDASAVAITEVEKPAAGAGQVVVEVHAASLNPVDTGVRSGRLQGMMPIQLPATLGGDIAGVVTEVGAGVEGVAVGDKVYGQAAAIFGNSGAFAEFARTGAGFLAAAPADLSFNEAATLPLAGASAVQALTQHIGLKAGQKILITGGAGSVGSIAVQVAKQLGAHVVASARDEGIEAAKSLGADEVIDGSSAEALTSLTGFDAVFDTVGGESFAAALGSLKPGGIGVSMAGQADQERAKELGVTAIGQFTQVTTATLDALRGFVEAGVTPPRIAATYSLEEVSQAYTDRESGKLQGKAVIQVKN